MKDIVHIRLIIYVLVAIILQVLLGQVTGLGQGSIGLIIFALLVEIDPKLSFRYMRKNIENRQNKRKG
jgi:hypothetical protein